MIRLIKNNIGKIFSFNTYQFYKQEHSPAHTINVSFARGHPLLPQFNQTYSQQHNYCYIGKLDYGDIKESAFLHEHVVRSD